MSKEVATIRVSGKSDCKAVAGSITKSLESGNIVEVCTIGAGALNQAVKAIAMTRGYIASKGYDVVTRPGFADTTIDGEERTVIKQIVSLA